MGDARLPHLVQRKSHKQYGSFWRDERLSTVFVDNTVDARMVFNDFPRGS